MKNEFDIAKDIVKECFWDYDITPDKVLEIIAGDDMRSKNILFEKILVNSQNLILSLSLFDKNDLQSLLKHYNIPSFNKEHIEKRKDMVEFFFFKKKLKYRELLWG